MNTTRLNILLVEDDPYDQMIFSHNLKKTTFQNSYITSVDSISKALDFLIKNDPDILFVDLGLPDGNGLTLLSKMLDLNNKFSAIVLTGNEDYGLLEQASRFDVIDFLVKSEITFKNLERSIRFALSLRSFYSHKVKMENQLHQAMRMETIGRFAGGIAHDLNNKFAIIGANLDFLPSCKEDDDLFKKRLSSALAALDQGAALVKQLLAYGRGQELQKKKMDLASCIDKNILLIRSLIRSDIEIEFTCPNTAHTSFYDPGQLDQVLTNLLVNCQDAIGNQPGKIQISLDKIITSKFEGDQSIEKYNRISVADTGSGMTSEEKQRAIEPFFTTKEIGKGTGLGLSVVDGIISQHGGFIRILDNTPKGTILELYIPECDKNVLQNPNTEFKQIPQLKEKKINGTVLLTDDEPTLREIITDCLRSQGCIVIQAEDGVEALNVFKNNFDQIDVVVTDVVMPRMGGKQLADEIRKISSTIPIVFVSGYSRNELTTEDGALPANSVLFEKPFNTNELIKTINDFIDSKEKSMAS